MHKTQTSLSLLWLLLPALVLQVSFAQSAELSAPNVVEISPKLVTAGQPSAEALASLAAQGFEVDIYLAPPTVGDAVKDEAVIVGKQGMVFINIPINFKNPTEKDFEAFAGVMKGLDKRKVLVHCQVDLRASSMVFLYRVVVGKEDPHVAYKAVAQVWSPEGPWKRLIQELLKKNGVNFEPY
jgi:protein tyrosine phosphatase (PTP) superfamily phosphohydrolase (DUF442 family)